MHWHRIQGLVFTLSEVNLVNDRLMHLNDGVRSWEFLCMRQFSDILEPKESIIASVQQIESNNPLVRVIPHAKNMKVCFGFSVQ